MLTFVYANDDMLSLDFLIILKYKYFPSTIIKKWKDSEFSLFVSDYYYYSTEIILIHCNQRIFYAKKNASIELNSSLVSKDISNPIFKLLSTRVFVVFEMKVKPIRYKVSLGSYLHFIDSQNCVDVSFLI